MSMAAKTALSRADLEGILAAYNLGKLQDFRPLDRGAVQTNFFLKTGKGKFVLKYYENRSKRYVLFEIELLNYLSELSYPCPPPISSVEGKFVGNYRGKPFVLFSFMEGEHRENVDRRLIAEAIGRLHQLTVNYKPHCSDARDSYAPLSCWRNAKGNVRRMESNREGRRRLKWLKRELLELRWPQSLPRGVCHCDTHRSNFLYREGEISAVLDFDDSSYTYLLYDLANMIYYWAWPHQGRPQFDGIRAILEEYGEYRKLLEVEKRHLYDLLKMVIFMSIGWFIFEEDDYSAEKGKIELLNYIGREAFYDRVFC